jgi:parallel beta-helix repeat protein
MHRKHAERARLALVCVALALFAAPAFAQTGTFYVDNQSGTCSPTGPGTSSSPYCTISAAIAAHKGPGVTILVRPGLYPETVTVPASGTAASRFVIQTTGPGVTVTGSDDFSATSKWASYFGNVWLASSVNWTPFQVFADGVRLIPSGATPTALPPGTFKYVNGTGLYVNVGGGNPGSHNARVGKRQYAFRLSGRSYVTINGFNVTSTEDRSIYLSGSSNNCIITNNTVSYAYRYGIQVNACTSVLVANNIVGDGQDHGIGITGQSTLCTVQDNESFRNIDPSTRRANGLNLSHSTNNLVQRNRLHDNQDTGLEFDTSADSNISIQNFSWNNGDHGYDHVGANGTIHVGDVAYHNYKDGFSIEGPTPNTHLHNCIATDNGLTTNEFNLWVDQQSTVGFVSDNNIFWNSTSQPPVKFVNTLYSSVADYINASGQDAHTLQADPLFVNPGAGDFHLRPGSPAIDNGISSVSNWPSLDADGHARVDDPATPNTGSGPPITYTDRGGLEYVTNQAPQVSAPGTSTASEGSVISVSVTASDPDGDPVNSLTANFSALPAGNNAAFTVGAGNTSGTMTWTPTYTDSRPTPYNVTFTASNALSSTATTAISVTNTDRAPVVSAPPTATVMETSALTVTVSASDPDAQAITSLTANRSALPAGNNSAFSVGAGNTSGTLTWTPTFDDGRPTPYNVTFTASNALSGSAVTAITVTNLDRAPSASAPATATTAEASAVSIPVTASDPDADAIISLTANVSALPAGNNAVFTTGSGNLTGTLTWTPTYDDARPTPYNVTFTASNALSGSASTAITVTNVDRAPAVSVPATLDAPEGALMSLTVNAPDPDGDPVNSLTANLSALPAGNNSVFTVGAGNTSATLTWTPTYTDSRPTPFNVSFTASNVLTGTASTAITVPNTDRAPVVVAPPTATVRELGELTINVTASDPDGEAITSLTADLTGLGGHSDATFTVGPGNTSGTMRWTATAKARSAPYNIEFYASNTLTGSAMTAITVTHTDQAPVISVPATATVAETFALSLPLTVSDPDGDAISSLTANLSGLPAGNNAAFTAGAGNTSGTLTWTPTYTDSRPTPFNVSFTASNLLSGSASTAITVTNTDRAPVAVAPATATGAETFALSVSVTASDPDADAISSLTANLSALPAGNNAVFTAGAGNTAGTLTWTPTYNDARPTPYNVTFTASNALSGSASTAITVTNTDRAPSVVAPATATIRESGILTVHVTASDPDGDAISSLTANLSALPSGNNAVFTSGAGNTTGTLTWTPTNEDFRPAPYAVTFTASNALSGSATTAITVTDSDQPPTVSAPATASVAEASGLSISVSASDPDGDPITSLTADFSALPAGNNAVFTPGAGNLSGTMTWTPTYADARPAPYNVIFTASDALSGSASTAITVTNVDRAPAVGAPATATTAEASALSIPVTASDPDGDAITSLTANLSALPAGNNAAFTPGAGSTTGTLTWTPTFADGRPTPYNVSFTASNALSGSSSTAITVTNVDRAPVVGAPATATGAETFVLSISVTASDPDGDAISSLTADLSALPSGNNAVFTTGSGNTSGTLTWTPTFVDARPTPYNVTFTASNALSGSAATAITVTDDDRAPVVSAPATANVVEGSALSITVTASDPDAQAITSLTANLSALPAGNNAVFTAGAGNTSGTLTWTPVSGNARPDPYNVTFTATNSLSGSATTAITVRTPIQPPTAVLVMTPSTGNAPLSTTADASGSTDPDGTIVSYLFNFGDGTVVGPQAAPTATHVYSAGNWTATVTVTDNDGAVGSASASLIVAAVPTEPNLVTNPSFEQNSIGWNGSNSATISRVPGGFDGTFALQCTRASGTTGGFGANDSPNWIASVPATGSRYRFTAWVRSVSATGSAKLQVREYSGSTLLGTVLSTAVTLSPTWKMITVDYVTATSGSTLDFQILDYPVATGEVFLTDNISIRRIIGGAAASLASLDQSAPDLAPLSATLRPSLVRNGATLQFTTSRSTRTRIEVFDVRGRLVRELIDDVVPAGSHQLAIDMRGRDGARLPSGTYFYRIQTEKEGLTGKFIVIR